MKDIESVQHSNIEESEMGQLHAMHLSLNGIAAVQARLPTGNSLASCADCGNDIPEARQRAMKGCTRCIHCQTLSER